MATTIEVQTWRDEQWVAETIQINDPEFENFLTAGVNFIFLHNDNKGSLDQLHLYYLNAEKKWWKVSSQMRYLSPRRGMRHATHTGMLVIHLFSVTSV